MHDMSTLIEPCDPVHVATFCFAVACCVLSIGRKRIRQSAQSEPKRKRRANDAERGELRQSSVRRILALDSLIFKCLFPLPLQILLFNCVLQENVSHGQALFFAASFPSGSPPP